MIEVLEPGLLTSVQDAFGRIGWRRYGVPVGGAADPLSARLANRLVGNVDGAALLEVTVLGPRLRFAAPCLVGLAGADLGATLADRPFAPGESRQARAGAELGFEGPRSGARAYLAFAGAIDVRDVLGSAATDLRSAIGGLDGRRLRAGDQLTLGDVPMATTPTPAIEAPRRVVLGSATATHGGDAALRVVPGPHPDHFDAGGVDALGARAWQVSPASDRAGVRLEGDRIDLIRREVASVGLPLGAIQVPPDGRPIIMLADRPVTGGYPVVACAIRADVGRVAQLIAGDVVRFTVTTLAEAREALRAQEHLLETLARDEPAADESAWAGALE
jgi:antagonist of KipI